MAVLESDQNQIKSSKDNKGVVRSEAELVAELTKLKKSGKKWESGSKLDKEISQIVGVESIPSLEVALNVLNQRVEKQKFDYVEEKISKVAEDVNEQLGGNEESREKIKTEITKIIDQSEFRTQTEEISALTEALPKKEDNKTEAAITAKEIKISLDKWQEDHIEEVRGYRQQLFEQKFEEEVKKTNPEINADETEAVKIKASLIAKVYFDNGGIENQKNEAIEANKGESIGKLRNSWTEVQALVGLMRKSSSEIEETVKKNDEVDSRLARIRIPYENLPQARAYDDVINNFRQPEFRQTFESISGGVRTGFRMVNEVSRMTGGWMEKGIVKVANNFAAKIGNQAASGFVKNSVGVLAKEGMSNGLKTILSGLAQGGVKAVASGAATAGAATGAGIAAGAAAGPPGWIIAAAMLGKKIIGGIADKLGINFVKKLKEGLAVTGNKMIDGVISGAGSLVAVPTMAAGTTVAAGGIVVAVIVGLFVYQMLQSNNISSLVPKIETEEGGGGGGGRPPVYGEITYTDDGRIRDCGVGMEVDFKRRRNKTRVSPGVLANGAYDEEFEEAVGESFGTRCGVVYAAQYLAFDFKYWVPYYRAGKYPRRGLNPMWGEEIRPDHNGRIYRGLDCSGFVTWAQYSGYGAKTGASTSVAFASGRNCERIKSLIEPGDTITLNDENGYHVAMVVAYDDKYIKFAHSGGGSGVSTGLISLCTGRGVDQGMNFEYLHKKIY